MAQRLKARRPDQEIYVPRSKRGENIDKSLPLNNVVNDVNIEDLEGKQPLKSKSKSKNRRKANHDNFSEEKRLETKKCKGNEIRSKMFKKRSKQDFFANENFDNGLVLTMDKEAMDSDLLYDGDGEETASNPSDDLSELQDCDTPEIDDKLLSAAYSISDILSSRVFGNVYQCLSDTNRTHQAIENCSIRMTSKLLQDSYESSLDGIRKSKQKLKLAIVFSEKLSIETLQDAYQGVNDAERRPAVEYPAQVLNNELHMQMMIPEIATNIINVAIENAIEITKASIKADVKSHRLLDATLHDSIGIGELQQNSDICLDIDYSLIKEKDDETSEASSLLEKLENLDINDDVADVTPAVIGNEISSKQNSTDINSCNYLHHEEHSNDNCKYSYNQAENDIINMDGKNVTEKTILLKKKKKKERLEVSPASKSMKKNKKKKKVPESDTTDQGYANCQNVLHTSKEEHEKDHTEASEDGTEDNWDSNYNEDGECLIEEIYEPSVLDDAECEGNENGEVIDYFDFQPMDIVLDIGEFGHVLELYDFSPLLKSSDLNIALKAAGIGDYTLHWVDDSHALAVFASKVAAHNAMKNYTPVLQMRQVVNGTKASRIKIKDLKDVLLPYKKRPQTTSMVARNLVAGSLGIRSNTTKEQRDKEKEMLRKAREEKRLKEKQKRDIWENPDGY